MDERQVRQATDALQKAVSAREPPATLIRLMKDLQKGVKPSEELLRKTQVGKIVNKLKSLQGIDPEIPQLASAIVGQWRTEIQRKGKEGAATPPRQNGASASPVPALKAESKSAGGDSKLPTGVPLDKRTWKTDKIQKADLTPESGRNNSIGLLYDGLVMNSSLPASEVLSKAKAIEASIIALPDSKSSHTSDFYKEKVRSLYQNLKNKSNPELRTRILTGQISPDRFAAMTHEELKGDLQRAEEAKIVKENLSNAMVPQEQKSVSDSLQCGVCKQKKVSFTQAQTRSADEPMTTFCECMNCGKRWKFS